MLRRLVALPLRTFISLFHTCSHKGNANICISDNGRGGSPVACMSGMEAKVEGGPRCRGACRGDHVGSAKLQANCAEGENMFERLAEGLGSRKVM